MTDIFRTFSFTTIILLISLTIACKNKYEKSGNYVQEFYDNEEKLTRLVQILRRDTLLDHRGGEIVNWTKFDRSTRLMLEDLGIEEVYSFCWRQDPNQRQFDFETNWRKEHKIHLYFNTLDSIETVKGVYRKDKNSNEFWGLGHNWALVSEIEFFPSIQ